MRHRLPYKKLFAAIIALNVLSLIWTSRQFYLRKQQTYRQEIKTANIAISNASPLNLMAIQKIALQLKDLHRNLMQSAMLNTKVSFSDMKTLEKLIPKLYPPVNFASIKIGLETSTNNNSEIVCTEHFKGSLNGGWHVENCIGAVTISKLVTVLVNFNRVHHDGISTRNLTLALQLLKDFETAYPELTVIMIGSGLSKTDISENLSVELIDSGNAIESWKAGLRLVKTPFTLFARNMFRFSHKSSPLDRLTRLLTSIPGVAVAAGAMRNHSGYWKVGCFQTKLQNYALFYQKGYHLSQNESMFCDYVDGPFLIHTHLMSTMKLNVNVAPNMVFQDLFLVLSKKWLSVAAPDVMFYANDQMAEGSTVLVKDTWLSLAKKWKLNRILIDFQFSHVLHKYSCPDFDIVCSESYHLFPICCLEQFSNDIRIWTDFCKNNNIATQLVAGNTLGAVKMADYISWDLDGQYHFPEEKYKFIEKNLPLILWNGLKTTELIEPFNFSAGNKHAYIRYFTSNLFYELKGVTEMDYDKFLYPDSSMTPVHTLVEIRGDWVSTVPNPGAYARNTHGIEYLRHAQCNLPSGAIAYPYESVKARHPGHQTCLDGFPADGSIPFRIPEW